MRPSSALRAAALVALALLPAACGSKQASPAEQQAQVRTAVAGMLHDLAAADGRAVCAGLTEAGQASVIKAVGPELTNFGIDDCDQVVHITGTQLTPKLRAELRHATVGDVSLQGDTATVQWSEIRSPGGDLGAFFGHPRALTLVDVNGTWLVSSL